ncbi:MAG: hypothetical protein H0Z24_10455 [Thermosipho sp. (in: Bacteria)]|nr:hypothetical protein [Thermosipho sp. (in: thermotogales)]
MNKRKLILISAIGILVILCLAVFLVLLGIRGEFAKYLEEKYSDRSFKIGFTKIDPIYGNFYAEVTCLDDATFFPISKSFNTKKINENYLQAKNQNQFNSKIKGIFESNDIENFIRSVTGSGEKHIESNGQYAQINIYLRDDAVEPILVIKKALNVLKNNNIMAEIIILTYEKDKHVYELRLSSDDYDLTEKEIVAKVRTIK